MKTRMLLAAVAALSASGVFACTGFAASLLTIADTPFGKFEVAVPEFAARDFSIADFGAKPDGTKCTDAFSAAFSAAEKAGGGRVVVPNGTWLTGAVHFRNNCNLYLSEGATPILLSPICRGTFDNDGKRLVDTTHASDGVCLGSYRDAMKELSAELDCDYVDMNGLTRELMERVGRDEAMKFFVISTGLVLGKDGEPSKDVTHPIAAGAEAFAKLFIEDVKARNLEVATLFK